MKSEAEFEAALERAVAGLGDPPAENSAEEDALLAVLYDISAYRPAVIPDAPPREPSRADRLMAEARALSDRVARDEERSISLRLAEGFRGIGNSVTGEPREH